MERDNSLQDQNVFIQKIHKLQISVQGRCIPFLNQHVLSLLFEKSILLLNFFQLGTLQWAAHSSLHLKDTTTPWVGAGKYGLAFISLCVPPCGR